LSALDRLGLCARIPFETPLALVLYQVLRRGLAKCALSTRSEKPPLPTPVGGYFVIETNSDLGWKSFDSGVVGEAVVGTGTG
jgi:hypothetical protein